jgi:hypothetical protein
MMGKNPERYCQIDFLNGDTTRFTFEAIRPDGDPTMGMAIDEMLNQRNLIFHLDERMVIVPMASVKTINVYPVPEGLPKRVIRAIDHN